MSQEPAAHAQESHALWGGRFTQKPDSLMDAINASIDIDKRLWREDIQGSRAHCAMLNRQGIVTDSDAAAILDGLAQIETEITQGTFVFRRDLEDIHMNIESRLAEIIGEPAGRLHTARSRNDQVATDFRLWMREAIDTLVLRIDSLRTVLSDRAAEHAHTIMPGFTHLQIAQPVTLADHLGAYHAMLGRDKGRFVDSRARMNECPLGAAALAGTPFPIDRTHTAHALGFDRPVANTMDAVSARDFAAEFLFACTQCGLHLSRLAEDIILWNTPQFGFIRLSDAWSTGSSIMPQKRNPDAAELIRAKTGRLTGNLVQILMVLKALPMTYNKDLQEDKQPVFDSFDTLSLCLEAMEAMLRTASWNTLRMRDVALQGHAKATALADWLVMSLGLPFREAHHITGRLVRLAESEGKNLHEIPLQQFQSVEPRLTESVYDILML